MGDDERRCGIGKNEPDAFGRMVGVERNIGRSDLEQREQRHIGFDPAIEQNGDPIAGLDALAKEEARHLIGARAQFSKAYVRVVGRDRRKVGIAAARLLEHFVETFAIAPSEWRGVADDRERPDMLQAAQRGQGVALEPRLAKAYRGSRHGGLNCHFRIGGKTCPGALWPRRPRFKPVQRREIGPRSVDAALRDIGRIAAERRLNEPGARRALPSTGLAAGPRARTATHADLA